MVGNVNRAEIYLEFTLGVIKKINYTVVLQSIRIDHQSLLRVLTVLFLKSQYLHIEIRKSANRCSVGTKFSEQPVVLDCCPFYP